MSSIDSKHFIVAMGQALSFFIRKLLWKSKGLQRTTLQHRTLQHRTLQYRTLQHRTLQHRTLQLNTITISWVLIWHIFFVRISLILLTLDMIVLLCLYYSNFLENKVVYQIHEHIILEFKYYFNQFWIN